MKTKFIRKANAWLVTIMGKTAKGKIGQMFHWFGTPEEAKAYIQENEGTK